MHLWSLGVEEQFYFLFPLIAWAMWRYRKWALPLLVIAAVLSFGADVQKLKTDPSAAFYLPQYRFWEILVGSVLAYVAVFHPALISCSNTSASARKTAFNTISLLGVSLLIASVAIIDKTKSFPGAWALMPVMGSALLILAGSRAWFNNRVLANRVFVGIGLISYPLYLWHWPVITFMRIVGADELSVWEGVIAIAASFLLAFVTYKFIELPFRAAKLKLSKTGVLVFLGFIVAISGTLSFTRMGCRVGRPSWIAKNMRSISIISHRVGNISRFTIHLRPTAMIVTSMIWTVIFLVAPQTSPERKLTLPATPQLQNLLSWFGGLARPTTAIWLKTGSTE